MLELLIKKKVLGLQEILNHANKKFDFGRNEQKRNDAVLDLLSFLFLMGKITYNKDLDQITLIHEVN